MRWCAVMLVAAACTPAPSTPVPDAAVRDAADAGEDAGPPDVTQYCELTADAYCAFYVRCGRMAVTTEDACRAVFLESCNGRYERVYRALANAGLMELSADGMAGCRAHLETVACAWQVQDLDGPCGAMWRGLQPEDGPCGLGIESLVCAEGTRCVLGLDFCGTCRRFADDGEACDPTCGQTSSCSAENVCAPRSHGGEPCGEAGCVVGTSCVDGVCTGPSYVRAGDACDQAHRCPYKSQCSGGGCRESALLDEECTPAAGCATGFCGSSGRCEALKDPGEPCGASNECVSGACSMGACLGNPGACFSSR